MLSTVKVPCDPAQVIVNHVSFRVIFASPPPVSRVLTGHASTAPLPRVPAAVPAAPAAAGRRRPVVWSGRSAPGDAAARSLLGAVPATGGAGGNPDSAATRVLPRVTTDRPPATTPARTVVPPRSPEPSETGLLPVPGQGPGTRYAGPPGLGDVAGMTDPEDTADDRYELSAGGFGSEDESAEGAGRRVDSRHAYYPGRGLNLGIVLLPLRILLGFLAIYAGMGKLTDPVYFDGGERGSMVTWLGSLEPWSVADPLYQWALAHPVGAGLTVAFAQIIAGVLTLCGLWQRMAACLGAALSLALLVTVSWQHGPAYDTPDIILLAAWSPLVIAGAPAYSLDARLASEAWRTLGPRAPLSELRHRVLRRGALLAALLLGVALLLGAILGGAVRSAQHTTVPRPGEAPRNTLPGTTLPEDEADESESAAPTEGPGRGGALEEETGPPTGGEDGAGRGEPDAESEDPADEEPAPGQTVQVPSEEGPTAERTPEDATPRTGGTDDGPSDDGTGVSAQESESSAEDGGATESEDGSEDGSPAPIGGLLG